MAGETVKIQSQTIRRALVRNSIKLAGVQIVALLRGELELPEAKSIPKNAVVSFLVPSGGDYSGMNLELNKEQGITVSWEAEV